MVLLVFLSLLDASIAVVAAPIVAAAAALVNPFSLRMLIDVRCGIILKIVSLTGTVGAIAHRDNGSVQESFSLWVVWIKRKMIINLKAG